MEGENNQKENLIKKGAVDDEDHQDGKPIEQDENDTDSDQDLNDEDEMDDEDYDPDIKDEFLRPASTRSKIVVNLREPQSKRKK